MDKKEILIKTGLKYCAVTGPMDFYQLSMSLKEIKKKLEAEKEEMKEFGGEADNIAECMEGFEKLVAKFVKEKAKVKVISRKAIEPTKEEVDINPRSRSAKLRVIEKL